MSGHSKWSTIKHKKGALDAKRGRIFTRLIKEITVAAKIGGGDADGNPRLRGAIAEAKANNMPADNIKRAIQKGTGELPGVTYEERTYEGYGPGGAAVLMQTMTDNVNRTTAELRHMLGKHGGNLAEANAVAWMFERKGQIVVARTGVAEDTLLEIILEAGGEDLRDDGENYEIITSPEAYENVKKAIEAKSITTVGSELSMVPQNYVRLEGKKAQQMLGMMEALEDHEDMQKVFANFDIDESEIQE
jgi:YebC/PmpR family DNA-binding regulatory protein